MMPKKPIKKVGVNIAPVNIEPINDLRAPIITAGIIPKFIAANNTTKFENPHFPAGTGYGMYFSIINITEAIEIKSE